MRPIASSLQCNPIVDTLIYEAGGLYYDASVAAQVHTHTKHKTNANVEDKDKENDNGNRYDIDRSKSRYIGVCGLTRSALASMFPQYNLKDKNLTEQGWYDVNKGKETRQEARRR